MQKTALGCRCSHARETLHAVCPKLLKFLFVLRSAYQRRWCSSTRNKMILHSMQRIILGSKACLLHDCPLLSLERLSLGNSELPKMSCTPCKGSFWAAKHAFCMTVLCCLRKSCFSTYFRPCPYVEKTFQTLIQRSFADLLAVER